MAQPLLEPRRAATTPLRQRLGQLGWLVAIWAAGVLTLGGVAAVLRLVMEAVGLKGH